MTAIKGMLQIFLYSIVEYVCVLRIALISN